MLEFENSKELIDLLKTPNEDCNRFVDNKILKFKDKIKKEIKDETEKGNKLHWKILYTVATGLILLGAHLFFNYSTKTELVAQETRTLKIIAVLEKKQNDNVGELKDLMKSFIVKLETNIEMMKKDINENKISSIGYDHKNNIILERFKRFKDSLDIILNNKNKR